MTFKQLVDKYRFEDIIPELTELWDKGNLYLFRQALDILRELEPLAYNGDGNIIEVHKVKSEIETYNRVVNLSGWGWEENLDWRIIVDDECYLSEKQLLALCLWERTFYGFSPDQELETFKVRDEELEGDSLELDELGKRRELIEDICSKYSMLKPDDFDFIKADQELIFHAFVGLSDSPQTEMDYIKESILRYSDLPKSKDKSHCVALLCIPEKFELTDDMIDELADALKSKTECLSPLVYRRYAADRKHITLTILYV